MDLQLRFSGFEGRLDDVRRELAGVEGVERLDFQWDPQAPGSKSAGLAASLLVAVLPGAVEGALKALAAFFTRPGSAPTEIEAETGGGKVKVKFDPRRTSNAEIAELVTQLLSAVPPRATPAP